MILRRYEVTTMSGYEGSFFLKDIILGYAEKFSLRPGEVQRISDLDIGERFFIVDCDITITRTS